ncbi:MAG TPA: OmpA family protein [Stellaceae bacterium]|nr:OmpA family protein [Stellaceae bacterium]
MSHTRSLVLGAAFLALTASSGFAQTGGGTPGPYVRLEGGWSHPEDLSSPGLPGFPSGTAKRDDGYIVGGAAGYKWGPWRGELNLDYAQQDLSSGRNVFAGGPAGTSANLNGNSADLSFMLNGYYDINTGTRFTPYVGFGIGGDYYRLNQVHTTNRTPNVAVANSDDFIFAFQPIVGVSYAITDQLLIGLEYRYFSTTDATLKYSAGGPTSHFKVDPTSHNVLASLTYHFNPPSAPPPTPAAVTPPPPPPPPPAAAPAKQDFIVFFDFDKSTLTADGQKVVDAAAAAYKSGGRARISVAGYTDAAGTASYNVALSKRRADTVQAALVRDGVPANQIAASWFGKTHQRVPTPDGVREPQNRRVEIEF